MTKMKASIVLFVCFTTISLLLGSCVGCGSGDSPAPPPLKHITAVQQGEETTRSPLIVSLTKDGGVYRIPVRINGTELDFIFDTGASLISISALEAALLLKNGKISNEDIMGTSELQDATGAISEGVIINLKKVSIGSRSIENVKATVIDNSKAPLLLGQSFLEQFGNFKMDYDNSTITFY